MLNTIRRTLHNLRRNRSGNATLLMAIGMPVLIGSSGMAVDFSQWYMWQRELQFAADQAALAGAWARSNTATRDTYVTRAQQEFTANLATTENHTTTPVVRLANYNGGTNNVVGVYATASKRLPFSWFVTRRSATASVQARASFSIASSYNACILAVNPTENRSAIFGNAITGGSNCGVGALSTATQAIFETGDSSVALGDIVSAGGVEDTFSNNGTIHEYIDGLFDPYAGKTVPSSSGQPTRTYSCPTPTATTTSWTADVSVRTVVTYLYKKGSNINSAAVITRTATDPGYAAPSDVTVGPTTTTYTSAPTAGSITVGPTTSSYDNVTGTGQNKIWRASVTTTITTKANVVGPIVIPGNDGVARPLPGIYTNISINCDTEFQSGIYFVSGSIDFGNNRVVTGSDVMFLITGSSNDVRINSTSDVSLTGISKTTLVNRYGMTDSDADAIKTMLFYDLNNTSDFDINGNADLDLSGILYMPSREVKINGNMSQGAAGSRCIMVVSDTFWITGSANLSNFCSTTGGGGFLFGDRTAEVRLIA